MRAKRSKQYRKLMQHYNLSFGFREPYQVLIDPPLIQAAARFKMKLGSLLAGALHGEIKPMITQCCIRHLYDFPAATEREKREKEGWIEVAKQAERRRCGHHELEEPLSTLDCLISVVDPKGSGTNKNRYVVATQEQEVRQALRRVAGVPLVYIHRSVMILEPMAAKSEKVREAGERSKVRAGLRSSRPVGVGGKRKSEEEVGEGEHGDVPERAKAIAAAEAGRVESRDEPAAKKRKVKGPKGPNPLSVRKTKTKAREEGGSSSKPVARQVEGERAAVRQAAKSDPHATEKATDAEVAAGNATENGGTDGPKKRKRKRKAKQGSVGDGDGDRGGEAAEAAPAATA